MSAVELAERITLLVKAGNVKALGQLLETVHSLDLHNAPITAAIATLEGLDYLYSHGYPKLPSNHIIHEMLKTCNFESLESIHKHHPERICPESLHIYDLIATENILAMLDWAHSKRAAEMSRIIIECKAEYKGRIEVLQWLFDTFGHMLVDIGPQIGVYSRVDVIQWYEKHSKGLDYQCILEFAVRRGAVNIVQWVHEQDNKLRPLQDNIVSAVCFGHFDVLKALYSFDKSLFSSDQGAREAFEEAYLGASGEIFSWAVETGQVLAKDQFTNAALWGRFGNTRKPTRTR